MRKRDVVTGGVYVAKVSDVLTTVRLTNTSLYGGWDAVNTKTGRSVRIRTAARLREETVESKVARLERGESVPVTGAEIEALRAAGGWEPGCGMVRRLGAGYVLTLHETPEAAILAARRVR